MKHNFKNETGKGIADIRRNYNKLQEGLGSSMRIKKEKGKSIKKAMDKMKK